MDELVLVMAKKAPDTESPKFPYTISPASLRKLLTAIPSKPRPSKLTLPILKSWGVTNTNDTSPLRVLKNLGMISASGEPLQGYNDFMKPSPHGPKAFGARIKEKYAQVFEGSHEPHKDQSFLKSYFNINAGGGEEVIRLQINTFKTLCEFADFEGVAQGSGEQVESANGSTNGSHQSGSQKGKALPPIQIDLHIHLPENKTTRDYEAIIQDIAKYIYGRGSDGQG